MPQDTIKSNKKKILIVSDEWLAPSLTLALKNEGNDVAIAIKRSTNILRGTIKRIPYADRLEYAKDCDLVIYEDKSNRNESSDLRKTGVSVIGGDKLTDKLELDRLWGNKIAEMSGIMVPEMINIESFEEIAQIIAERGGKWVLKQCGKLDEVKGLNFVSKMPNSEDLLDFLPTMEKNWIDGVKKEFVLQQKIEGYEFAVGSYWNGNEFMKDADGDELCCENWEHKALFPGNLGESTGEQYTVMHYIKARDSKLFSETLDKCRDLLKRIDYRGYFDVNTIVNKKGSYFLEFTPRFGVPLSSGQIEIQKSSWYEFFKAMADGLQPENYDYNPDFCIVSWLYTKPFPFVNSHKMTEAYESAEDPKAMEDIAELMSFRMSNSEGIMLNFTKDFTTEDWSHVHPDGLRFQDNRLKIANADGYVATVTSMDKTVENAGEKVNNLLKKIIIPKAFWRNDFDRSNYHKSKEDLTAWGYILSDEEKASRESELMNTKKSKKEEKRRKVRETLKKIIREESK